MLPMLTHDKANHFMYGAVISSISMAVQLAFRLPSLQSAGIALGVAAIVGALKEVIDRRSPNHTADKMDFVVTALGGLVVAAPFVLI